MTIRAAALPLLLVAFSGCAAARSSLAARFVKQGEPAVDLGGPPVGDARRAPPPPVPGAVAPAAPKPAPLAAGTTVESSDPALAAALLAETMVPSPPMHVAVAREYIRLGIRDAAFSHASLALALDARFAEAHELIARIWRDWGFPQEGLGPAERAVYFAPRSASARNTLGTVFDALNRPELAAAAYGQALALDPAAAWTMSNACYSEFRAGRLAQARERCQAALAIDPDLRVAHNNFALALAASGDLARARVEFLAAGDDAAADYNLGMVYLAGHEYVAAADRFEQAIRHRADFTAAKARAHFARTRALTGGE